MSAIEPERVFSAPLHATVSADGMVKVFLPSGGSLCLTPEAAAGSSILLATAATNTVRKPRRAKKMVALPASLAADNANVVVVDFARKRVAV
jgi:hypothetical protein